jgi:hypothetical protein
VNTSVNLVVGADKKRAIIAVSIPLAYPFILASALLTSGHSLADYPSLLANGGLSYIRQGSGWVALVGWAAIYMLAALRALLDPVFIETSNLSLRVPSGEAFPISDIESISLVRGFWHRYMRVRAAGADRTVVVTFARGKLADVKRSLKADPHLGNVNIT